MKVLSTLRRTVRTPLVCRCCAVLFVFVWLVLQRCQNGKETLVAEWEIFPTRAYTLSDNDNFILFKWIYLASLCNRVKWRT